MQEARGRLPNVFQGAGHAVSRAVPVLRVPTASREAGAGAALPSPRTESGGDVWGPLTAEPDDMRIYMSFDNIKSQQSPGGAGREQVGERGMNSLFWAPGQPLPLCICILPVAMVLQAEAQTIQRTQLLRSLRVSNFPPRSSPEIPS